MPQNYDEDNNEDDRVYCEECGDTINDISNAIEILEGFYCESCYDDVERNNINESGYKPKPKFTKLEKDDDLFMGFELEMESMSSVVGRKSRQLLEYLKGEGVADLFYLKEDGSLDNGFELVSHPVTLNYLRKKLKMKKILTWLKQNQFKTTQDCGLHVHINSKILTNEDVIKLRAFFSLNQEYLFKFSHRADLCNDYCQYEDYDLDMFIDLEEQEDRYWALNLNTGQDTIEVRIFSSTLNEVRFLGYLEFVDALVRYCKKNSIQKILGYNNSKESWTNFMSWLAKYKIKYRTTKTTLDEDKLMTVANQIL
jgi:adenosine deaminase